MFFILAESKDGGKTWSNNYDIKYDNGKEAQEAVKDNQEWAESRSNCYWRDQHEKDQAKLQRWRVRRVVDTDDDNFLARETAKNLQNIELPYRQWWELAHIHPEDKQKVRFFRSIENAIEERYTVCTMSRFLSTYCNYEDEELEQKLCELNYYDHDAVFKITQDADEIQAAYENGPRSCMNDPDDYPLGNTHPSRVYAGPDLAVAILMRGDRCVGRAVVWPEKKIWCSAYGHIALVRHELEKLGYERKVTQNAWRGARIMKIFDKDEDRFVCPYLDMTSTVRQTRCGNYLRFAGEDGSLDTRGCEGFVN